MPGLEGGSAFLSWQIEGLSFPRLGDGANLLRGLLAYLVLPGEKGVVVGVDQYAAIEKLR